MPPRSRPSRPSVAAARPIDDAQIAARLAAWSAAAVVMDAAQDDAPATKPSIVEKGAAQTGGLLRRFRPGQNLDAELEAYEREQATRRSRTSSSLSWSPPSPTGRRARGRSPSRVVAEPDVAEPEAVASIAEPEPELVAEPEPVAEAAAVAAVAAVIAEPEVVAEPESPRSRRPPRSPSQPPRRPEVAAEPESSPQSTPSPTSQPSPSRSRRRARVAAAAAEVVAEPAAADRRRRPADLADRRAGPDRRAPAARAAAPIAQPPRPQRDPAGRAAVAGTTRMAGRPRPAAGLPFLDDPPTPTGGIEALWAAVGPRSRRTAGRPAAGATAGGVQPCVSCGLSLSATARFCRRCGTPQAADAARVAPTRRGRGPRPRREQRLERERQPGQGDERRRQRSRQRGHADQAWHERTGRPG